MQNLTNPPHTFQYSKAVFNNRVWLRQSRFSHSTVFGSALRLKKTSQKLIRSTEKGICRSELLQDAPFVLAIGACVVSSLVLQKQKEDPPESPPLGEDDVRNGAMTIISFIPLFNWLGWVFAWLDTNDQRYLFYASVYLAPYVRTGFSFSTDENWLLILSYFACIAHVQLEINLQGGGIELGDTFFKDGLWRLLERVKLGVPEKQSKNFHESISTDHEDTSPDFSQIELSEFDKKLSDMRQNGKGVENSGDSEKSSERDN